MPEIPNATDSQHVRWEYRSIVPNGGDVDGQSSYQEVHIGKDLRTGDAVQRVQDRPDYHGVPVMGRGHRYFADEKRWENLITAENAGAVPDIELEELPADIGPELNDRADNTVRTLTGRRVFGGLGGILTKKRE